MDPNPGEKIHVVVGATGGTGRALVRELLRRGRRVRAVNRSGTAAMPAGVDVVAGNALDAASMVAACRDAGVVYNAVNPPLPRWREDFPAAIDGTLAGAEAAGARMVFVDDTWMYGKVTGPMTEDLPPRPVSDKGLLRAWLAERVLAAHAQGRVETVIGRATELYGPAVESLLGRNLFGPAVGRGPGLWIGKFDEPLAPTFIDDFAYGLADLAEREGTLGQAWHIPTPPAVTAREFIRLISTEIQRPLPVRRIGPNLIRVLGAVSPVAREGAEMLYQFQQPHVVDASRYLAVVGPGSVTDYRAGIRRTLAWYRTNRRRGLLPSGS
jgi:nucleoside-diphosphate-sugar epimerase